MVAAVSLATLTILKQINKIIIFLKLEINGRGRGENAQSSTKQWTKRAQKLTTFHALWLQTNLFDFFVATVKPLRRCQGWDPCDARRWK